MIQLLAPQFGCSSHHNQAASCQLLNSFSISGAQNLHQGSSSQFLFCQQSLISTIIYTYLLPTGFIKLLRLNSPKNLSQWAIKLHHSWEVTNYLRFEASQVELPISAAPTRPNTLICPPTHQVSSPSSQELFI